MRPGLQGTSRNTLATHQRSSVNRFVGPGCPNPLRQLLCSHRAVHGQSIQGFVPGRCQWSPSWGWRCRKKGGSFKSFLIFQDLSHSVARPCLTDQWHHLWWKFNALSQMDLSKLPSVLLTWLFRGLRTQSRCILVQSKSLVPAGPAFCLTLGLVCRVRDVRVQQVHPVHPDI